MRLMCMQMDGSEDYNNVDFRRNSPAPVPRGVWSMEAISSYVYGRYWVVVWLQVSERQGTRLLTT